MSLTKRVSKGQAVSRKVSKGYYDKMDIKKMGVSPREFWIGMNIELEHYDITKGDLTQTAKITIAHLKEFPDYNTRLKRMERQGERAFKKKKRRLK